MIKLQFDLKWLTYTCVYKRVFACNCLDFFVNYIWKVKEPNQLIKGGFYNFISGKENSMGPFIIRCMLMTISLQCVEAISSKTYGGKTELFNKVSIDEPLENKHTGSLLRCIVLSGIGCNCFNFKLQTGTCLLYNSCNPLHMTVSESGWRFFTDTSHEPISEYMLSHYL